MALFVSPGLVVSPVDSAPAWYPLIGWQNVVTFGKLSATSSASGYPVTNLASDSTIERWKGGSAAELLVTVSDLNDQIDYVGIARHNLGTAGIQVSVETLTAEPGAVWTEVFAPVVLGDNAPAVLRFSAATIIGLRLRLAAGTAAPDIAVLRVGKLLKMQRGLQADFVPLHRAVTREKLNGRSEAGDYFGAIVTNAAAGSTAQFKMLGASWYDSNAAAFVLAANKGGPFFFVWDPDAHPGEVAYCWLSEDATPRFPMLNKNYYDLSLSIGGIVT